MPRPDAAVGPAQDRVQKTTDEDAVSVEAGLDALDTPVSALDGGLLRRIAGRGLPPIAVVVLLVVVWQVLWASAFWPEFKLPAPAAVWSQIWELVTTGQIFDLFWVS